MGKYGIGARVVDKEGDTGVITNKRKGERYIKYDDLPFGMWRRNEMMTPINAPSSDGSMSVNFSTGELKITVSEPRAEKGETEFSVGDRVVAERRGAGETGKFKVGDKVVATNSSYGDDYIKGETYEVRAVYNDSIRTVFDSHGNTTNGWGAANFELAPPLKIGEYVTATGYVAGANGENSLSCSLRPASLLAPTTSPHPCSRRRPDMALIRKNLNTILNTFSKVQSDLSVFIASTRKEVDAYDAEASRISADRAAALSDIARAESVNAKLTELVS